MVNRFKIGTKIGASFALGMALFTGISAIAYRGIHQLIETSRLEAHTYQVLSALELADTQLSSAEASQRGYLITGESNYLNPYTAARSRINQILQDVQSLTQDNASQQSRLTDLISQVNRRFEMMQTTIDIRRQGGLMAAQRQVQINRGQELTEEIRRLSSKIKAEEQSLLAVRQQANAEATRQTLNSLTFGVPLYLLLLGLIGFWLSRHISRPLRQISEAAEQLGGGNLSVRLPKSERSDEVGVLANTFNQMADNLQTTNQRNDEQNWLKSNLAEVGQLIQGQRNQQQLARQVLSYMAPRVNAQQGVLYLLASENNPPLLKLLSSYAHQERRHLGNEFRLGEGLVGQCALEQQRILLTEVPADYIRISSGLGESAPLNIVVLPILFEEQTIGVLELASLQRFREIELAFLEQLTASLGVALNTIAADQRTAQLLEEAQALTEELQQQQDDLQSSNRRLEQQATALQTSEVQLKEQQEELQQTNEELQQLNEELEEKAELLAVQKQEVEAKNQTIEQARQALEEKAAQLTLSSKYKSEFLANMSHELRTPLNSLLILARLLSENSDQNLTEKQVEYSQTIYAAGTDLLSLINDILDLAKIESGTILIALEPIALAELQTFLERTFRQEANAKGLEFSITLSPDLPSTILTDPKRLQQILKNLLANAFKFTEQGSITLRVYPTVLPIDPLAMHPDAETDSPCAIAFAVSDTGIGIAPDKQQLVFEAFQQADGTTSRKYGGTGLGLSISRELAHRLGGTIDLVSQVGQGSTFTVYLPTEPPPTTPPPTTPPPPPTTLPPPPTPTPLNEVNDDRAQIRPGDRVLLIIEDDINFVRILLDMARQQGFKVLAALRSAPGLALAQQYKPDAIMLDLRLPDMDGWTVLDRLKHDPNTRHIPVHILSVDEAQQRSLQLGAIAYLQKPVSAEALTAALVNIKGFIERQVRNLLVVEDDDLQAQSIRDLIGNGDVQTTTVNTGAAALRMLRSSHFDCVVLDLGLPDMTGFDLIEQIKQDPNLLTLPIVVYTGKELTPTEETQLKRLAETIIVKDVRSPERLLDETALFLHRVQANLPQPKRQILEQLHQHDPVLANKTVLIVDDDVRNIFALTSLLESYQMQVLFAEHGRDGIALLEREPAIDIVLMDVMMPELDGYEATRTIRRQDRFKTLPILMLTAKAMQGDREKCLEAGASDYITKPVDTEQLLSLLRVWLYR
jgi:CheY-like chemotaxis protein/signal transduction histidine kinase